jgi:hypothetical protein
MKEESSLHEKLIFYHSNQQPQKSCLVQELSAISYNTSLTQE